MNRRIACIGIAAFLCGSLASGCGALGTGPDSGQAQYHRAPASNAVDDQYVFILASDVADVSRVAGAMVKEARGQLLTVYEGAVRGFAAQIPDDGFDRLRSDPRVVRIYEDLWLAFSSSKGGTQLMDQNGDPWGLDRIDQATHPLNREYAYSATGSGVTVYVIDSGIDASHADFGGRATNRPLTLAPAACDDDELGHGTAVASIAAGATYGVAKNADVVGLRVAPCHDPRPLFSLVLKAVQWVATPGNRVSPSVVNFSLGWRLTTPIDAWRILIEGLIEDTIDQGVTYVVSANNVGGDACGWWPARLGGAITVAGTYRGDARVEDSNWGPCVDLFAPGINLLAASTGGGASRHRGTSFAAPHVAGATAMLLEQIPTLDAIGVKQEILSRATTGVVTNSGPGSPDRLLFVR